MDRRVKIGFVGCGAFCSGTHIPNAHANPMLETVAFCDLDQARLEQLNEQYKPKYVTADEIEYGYYYDRMILPDKGHYGELEHFCKCIVEGRKPDTDVIKGALANLIAWAAMESWDKGAPVDLDFKYLREL